MVSKRSLKPRAFRRNYAAKTLQRAWRARKRKQSTDYINTNTDVKRAVNSMTPGSVIIRESTLSLTTTPITQQVLSDIEYSNSNDRPDSRKSKNISAGHFKFRGLIQVGDKTNLVRVMVVRNKDPLTAAAFNPSTMFQMNNGIGTQPTTILAEPNLRKVQVKYDHVFNLSENSETHPGAKNDNIYFDFKINLKETWKYFTETNNTSELTRNMKDYYLVAFSDSSITPNPRLGIVSYTWFKNHTR